MKKKKKKKKKKEEEEEEEEETFGFPFSQRARVALVSVELIPRFLAIRYQTFHPPYVLCCLNRSSC